VRPYLKKKKKIRKKRVGGLAQGVVLEFKPQYCQNKQIKKDKKEERTNK
jgi:hypothetical protein